MVVRLGHGLRRPVLVGRALLEVLEVAAVGTRAGGLARGLVERRALLLVSVSVAANVLTTSVS